MEKELTNNYLIVLAALLNDIGIFEQRIVENPNNDYSEYSFSYFNKFIKNKSCLSEKDINTLSDILQHKNSDFINKIEQANKLDYQESKATFSFNTYRKPLISLLSQIQIKENEPLPKNVFYYLPAVLNHQEIFAEKVVNNSFDDAKLKESYKKLYDSFIEESKKLPDTGNILSLIDNLLFLFEKYLCYVPINNGDQPTDISLFDHIKTVTTLVSCLINSNNQTKPFLIVAADVSGIQNFIYSEQSPVENTTKGLGKRLRGKSFYLSLLTDTFSERFLEIFGLSRANILINGGGHFVILLPNTADNNNKLKQEVKNIQEWFYKQYKGDLNLIVEAINASEDVYKNFNEWYNTISSRLQKAKKQRSLDALDEIFKYDLDKLDISEYRDHINYQDTEEYKSLNTEYEKNLYGLSSLFENIGKELPKSNYIVQINSKSNVKPFDNKKYFYIPFSKFNVYWVFLEEKEKLKFLNSLQFEHISKVRLLKINNTNILVDFDTNNKPMTIGFKFIGTEVPKENYEVMEFKKIAELNNEETNVDNKKLTYPLLGTLRMDVDNLGAIFSNGLERKGGEENLRTLTRVVALSRMFNLFFCGYLNKIAAKWSMYITYSGGDDLFVVGSWINSIGFAEELRNEFDKFVCTNKNVTISGGLFLSKDNYPIGKAAKYAGEAEDKAKHSALDKDCISAFDRVFKWQEFNKYLCYGKELEQLVISKDSKLSVNKSFIHRILTITNEIFAKPDEINMKYFEKIALIKYLFARAPREIDSKKIELLKNDPDKANLKIKLLGKLILEESQDYLKNFIIPASYIILKHRSTKNKE